MKEGFHVFDTREEWLQARKTDTVGASSLAQYMVTGERATPLPEGIPALDSALKFGSDWEPYIVELVAQIYGLRVVDMNTPVDKLKPGEIAWYDNSFYSTTTINGANVHASLDCALRDDYGHLHIVEIKTAKNPAHIEEQLWNRYVVQSMIETYVTFLCTPNEGLQYPIIACSKRPSHWESMTEEEICKVLQENWTLHLVKPAEYDQIVGGDAEHDPWQAKAEEYLAGDKTEDSGDMLLEAYLRSAETMETAKSALMDWLESHPGMVAKSSGKVAKVKTSPSKKTDWKQLTLDLGIGNDVVDKYVKTTTIQKLSVVKDKEKKKDE